MKMNYDTEPTTFKQALRLGNGLQKKTVNSKVRYAAPHSTGRYTFNYFTVLKKGRGQMGPLRVKDRIRH